MIKSLIWKLFGRSIAIRKIVEKHKKPEFSACCSMDYIDGYNEAVNDCIRALSDQLNKEDGE